MNILVTGGTGTVGSQVVRELLTRGAQVQVLTRDAAKASKLPAGVKAVTGDLSKVETVKRVFKDVDCVFLINTVSPTEAQEGLLSVCALRNENVKRLVPVSPPRRRRAVAPHGGKPASRSRSQSGVLHDSGRTTSQNDYWFGCVCSTACTRSRLGRRLHRVDVRAPLAEAAARATSRARGPRSRRAGAHTSQSTAEVGRGAGQSQCGGNDHEAGSSRSICLTGWCGFQARCVLPGRA
jgi:hypothetical protein